MEFSQDRVQQRLVPGSSTIQFLRVGEVVVHVEVFKVLVQDRIQQRIWSSQVFSQARVPQPPHRVVCVTMQMRLYRGVFALFPVRKKCEVGFALGVGTAPRVEPIHAGELMRTGMLQGDVVISL